MFFLDFDFEEMYCSKKHDICICKNICNSDIMKINNCYKNLKQLDLFENLNNHNLENQQTY